MESKKIIHFQNFKGGNLILGNTVRIPVFKAPLWAGTLTELPDLGSDYFSEYLDIPEEYIKNPDQTYAYKVNGDSMEPKLHDRDRLIVDCSEAARLQSVNKIIVALVDGEFNVKRLKIIKNHLYLVADNPIYPPKQVDVAGIYFKVWGVVLGISQFIPVD